MQEGTYVYLLWERDELNPLDTRPQLHGIYANREDADQDARTMQEELNRTYGMPTTMSVQPMRVDTKPVA